MVCNVAREAARLVPISGPGAEIHRHEPTPQNIVHMVAAIAQDATSGLAARHGDAPELAHRPPGQGIRDPEGRKAPSWVSTAQRKPA